MRIIHAANYSFTRDGTEFFNCEYKFHTALCQAGHYVYPFSINDRARDNPLRTKKVGKKKTNRCLLDACENIRPDLLLLGHAQYIFPETLAQLRSRFPQMKIALWYVDAIYNLPDYQHLFPKLPYLDALFITTAGKHLEQFRINPNCTVEFIPNPSDPNIERLQADLDTSPKLYDLIFIGSDGGDPLRRDFLRSLQQRAGKVLRLGFAGCLGYPSVWGDAKDSFLRSSLMALNHSRRNDIELYSSDRLAQLAGNGLCTLSHADTGLQKLYRPDQEMIFYHTLDELIEKAVALAQAPERARSIATAGRLRTHRDYSALAIVQKMIDLTFA